MTRHQFEALMDANGWSLAERARWSGITPLCDVDTFNREMARPDGMIPVDRDDAAPLTERLLRLVGLN